MALLTYAKAAAPLVPGASLLPFVGGRGSEIPQLERTRSDVAIDRHHLAQYARVCGFRLRDVVPATYPHVLAFPLHMDLMTDGSFPFPAVGLVHIGNRITVHRALRADEVLDLRVTPTPVQAHPKGKAFSLVSEARVGDELVWEDESTFLRRGKADDGAERAEPTFSGTPPFAAEWALGGDLGRRYGGVSGDRNPIHIHPLTARAFGFPKAIAHGMWTKARSLAAIERSLPDSYTVDVAFKKPILLPSKVVFGRDGLRFQVRSRRDESVVHLDGEVTA